MYGVWGRVCNKSLRGKWGGVGVGIQTGQDSAVSLHFITGAGLDIMLFQDVCHLQEPLWDLAEVVHLSLLACFYGPQERRTLAFSGQL